MRRSGMWIGVYLHRGKRSAFLRHVAGLLMKGHHRHVFIHLWQWISEMGDTVNSDDRDWCLRTPTRP